MTSTLIDLPALRLVTSESASFPDGNRAAFSALEAELDTLRGRKFYGLVYETPEAMRYHAGLLPLNAAEETAFNEAGFPSIDVAAGRWARVKLIDWESRLQEIGPSIGAMIGEHGFDPSRPQMEYYRSLKELQLLVPVPG